MKWRAVNTSDRLAAIFKHDVAVNSLELALPTKSDRTCVNTRVCIAKRVCEN